MGAAVTVIVIFLVVLVVLGVVVAGVVRRREGPPPVADAMARAVDAPVATLPPLTSRLGRTRRAFGDRLGAVFGRARFDDGFWSDLEDGLVASDMGVAAAAKLVDRVKERGAGDAGSVRAALAEELTALFAERERALRIAASPAVVLVVGVNGTGKTTSIAKLAARLEREGRSVLLGAADTFRAAADEQLRRWAERVGVAMVGGQSGADPAAVAYDAYHSARARGHDVLIVDTAGRLQTKANLMDELGKIARVLRREAGELDEVLLVIDGTTGQNALTQARVFTEAVGVTGVVLTKLDGTARGGVAVAVEEELGVPVKLIGIGEAIEDLVPFDPAAFVDALLGPGEPMVGAGGG